MDLTTPVQTSYGQVSLQVLLDTFEKQKLYQQNKKEWLKTEEGKAYNRQKAKQFYERHRDAVLAKRAERYEKEHDLLLNRAKEYYALHTEEVKEKNRKRKEAKKQPQKIEPVEA